MSTLGSSFGSGYSGARGRDGSRRSAEAATDFLTFTGY